MRGVLVSMSLLSPSAMLRGFMASIIVADEQEFHNEEAVTASASCQAEAAMLPCMFYRSRCMLIEHL